ncbi:MAG: hypothetical protein ACOYEP_11960 [Limnochordia bacterium]|jgi:hypothetical protein
MSYHIQEQAKQPRDAAAVNATRWELRCRLDASGLPLETAGGAIRKGDPKADWIDAGRVGASGAEVMLDADQIVATGRGSRQMCQMDRYHFPRSRPKAAKRANGFRTGDMVRVVITPGRT